MELVREDGPAAESWPVRGAAMEPLDGGELPEGGEWRAPARSVRTLYGREAMDEALAGAADRHELLVPKAPNYPIMDFARGRDVWVNATVSASHSRLPGEAGRRLLDKMRGADGAPPTVHLVWLLPSAAEGRFTDVYGEFRRVEWTGVDEVTAQHLDRHIKQSKVQVHVGATLTAARASLEARRPAEPEAEAGAPRRGLRRRPARRRR